MPGARCAPGADVSGAPRRRWWLIAAVVGLAAAAGLLLRQSTPAFPPARALARLGIAVRPAPLGALSTLDTQEAISAASADGLLGPEGTPRLIRLTLRQPPFSGLAWEVSSTEGAFQDGPRRATGRWELVFLAARGGRLLKRAVVP